MRFKAKRFSSKKGEKIEIGVKNQGKDGSSSINVESPAFENNSRVGDESIMTGLEPRSTLHSDARRIPSKNSNVNDGASTTTSPSTVPVTADRVMPEECNTLYSGMTREAETLITLSTYQDSQEEDNEEEETHVTLPLSVPSGDSSIDSFYIRAETASTAIQENEGCTLFDQAYFLTTETDCHSDHGSILVSFSEDDGTSIGKTMPVVESPAIARLKLDNNEEAPLHTIEDMGVECEFVLKSQEAVGKEDAVMYFEEHQRCDDPTRTEPECVLGQRSVQESSSNKFLIPPYLRRLSIPKVGRKKRNARASTDSSIDSTLTEQSKAESFIGHVNENDSQEMAPSQLFKSTNDLLSTSGVELTLDATQHSAVGTGISDEGLGSQSRGSTISFHKGKHTLEHDQYKEVGKDGKGTENCNAETHTDTAYGSSTIAKAEVSLEDHPDRSLSLPSTQNTAPSCTPLDGEFRDERECSFRHNNISCDGDKSHGSTSSVGTSKSIPNRLSPEVTAEETKRSSTSSSSDTIRFVDVSKVESASANVKSNLEPIQNERDWTDRNIESKKELPRSETGKSTQTGIEMSLEHHQLHLPMDLVQALYDATHADAFPSKTPVFVIAKDVAEEVLLGVAKSLGKPVHLRSITIPTIERRSMADAMESAREAIMFTSDDRAVNRTIKSLVTPLHVKPISPQRRRKISSESRGVVGEKLAALASTLQKPVQLKPVTIPSTKRQSKGDETKPTEASNKSANSSNVAFVKSHIIITTNDKAVVRAMKSLVTPMYLHPISTQRRQKQASPQMKTERPLVTSLKTPVHAKPISFSQVRKSVGSRMDKVVIKNNDKAPFKVMRSLSQPVQVQPLSFGDKKKRSAGDHDTTSTNSTDLESLDDGPYALMEASSCGVELVRRVQSQPYRYEEAREEESPDPEPCDSLPVTKDIQSRTPATLAVDTWGVEKDAGCGCVDILRARSTGMQESDFLSTISTRSNSLIAEDQSHLLGSLSETTCDHKVNPNKAVALKAEAQMAGVAE